MIYEQPYLETDRLILKHGSYEDYVKVYEYDFTRLRNIAGEFEFVKLDPKVLEGYENDCYKNERMIDLILYLKDSNIPIGNIVLDRYDIKNDSLEVSVNIHPKYWRLGYMTEAVIKILDYAFNELMISNVVYSYAKDNFKSKGLSEKIGFEIVGTYIEFHKRIRKNIECNKTMMSKEKYKDLYGNKII